MIYADFDFYQTEYGGTKIALADFDRLAGLASAYITRELRGVPGTVTEGMRTCMCAVADVLQKAETGGDVLSVSNDGYSESYAASGKSTPSRIRELMSLYLWDSGQNCRWV